MVKWNYNNSLKKQSGNVNLHPELLCVIYRESKRRHLDANGNFEVMGFTKLRTECDKVKCSFHAHPWFQGKSWNDWVLVEYAELDHEEKETFKYYPSMVLGFVQFLKDEEVCAVIRTSTTLGLSDGIQSLPNSSLCS